MSESIHDVLLPYLGSTGESHNLDKAAVDIYLNRITTLDIGDLASSEPASVSQALHLNNRSIQALSKRSHKPIISAAQSLAPLSSQLTSVQSQSHEVKESLPTVESKASTFADKYRRSNESTNAVLLERRNALLLARNVDRIASVLELPNLLSSAISSSQHAGQGVTTGSQTTATAAVSSINYGSALDLQAHVKRLSNIYPHSSIISNVAAQSEGEMQHLTTNLISSLRSPNIKLAGAMRTIGWLRRVAPELEDPLKQTKSYSKSITTGHSGSSDGALGALFLVCRLASLDTMLAALDPLRELADDECTERQKLNQVNTKSRASRPGSSSMTGQQTERYLKRYIEIFREQSFAIVSMYKSIFPSALPTPGTQTLLPASNPANATTPTAAAAAASSAVDTLAAPLLLPLPSPLATFPAHLVQRLHATLAAYLPNITDPAARDSLLTQVLYCSGSLGRLGGDFGMMLALLEEEDSEQGGQAALLAEPAGLRGEAEWVRVMKKHRVQASRLELLASGVGSSRAGVKAAAAV